MKPELIRRQEATQATLEKYRGKGWSWKSGITCAHLARFHLRQMGHKPPRLPALRSEVGAIRALKERGWSNVADMLDAVLKTRIAPAQMLLGDLAVVRSPDGVGAIFVCAGPHKLLGWREDASEMVVLDVTFDQLDGAWRV